MGTANLACRRDTVEANEVTAASERGEKPDWKSRPATWLEDGVSVEDFEVEERMAMKAHQYSPQVKMMAMTVMTKTKQSH